MNYILRGEISSLGCFSELHPVLTKNGWIECQNIVEGEEIMCYDGLYRKVTSILKSMKGSDQYD